MVLPDVSVPTCAQLPFLLNVLPIRYEREEEWSSVPTEVYGSGEDGKKCKVSSLTAKLKVAP
jgi:hypothetical protein